MPQRLLIRQPDDRASRWIRGCLSIIFGQGRISVGASMITMTLPLPRERQLDWDAAARAIGRLRLEVVWAVRDDLLYEDYWVRETGDLPGAEAAFVALGAAQAELWDHACLLRGAIEYGWPEELIVFDTPTHHVWITGGPSWGEMATDLCDPLIALAEAGVTDAAGFDGYTAYASVPIEEREFDFDDDELRLVHFGVTAVHAAEQAATMTHPAPDASPRQWLNAWIAELEHDDDEMAGPALLRFAARGLALCVRLEHGDIDSGDPRVYERAQALARGADGDGLSDRPHPSSPIDAVRHARALATELRARVAAPDDPAAQHAAPGGPFSEHGWAARTDVLEIDVVAHVLTDVVCALADLYGGDVGALIDAPQEPPAPAPPRMSTRRFSPLSQYLSVLLIDDVDWRAAERAIDLLGADVRDERRADLAELRRLVAGDDYWRFVTCEMIGPCRLFIAAPHGEASPDVATSIARLGHDGVLKALGALAWSLPDPGFEGPVGSFVPGYGPRR